MSDVTIAVDEQTLQRARIRALDEGTTLDTVLREYLEAYAGPDQERREAWERIRTLARQSGMSSGGEKLPTREELYDRPVLRDRSTGW